MKKSQGAGFALTLLFGPFGLFYSHTWAAVGMLIGAVVFGAATYGAGALFFWLGSIIISFFTVKNYNDKVELAEQRHIETVAAASGETVGEARARLSKEKQQKRDAASQQWAG